MVAYIPMTVLHAHARAGTTHWPMSMVWWVRGGIAGRMMFTKVKPQWISLGRYERVVMNWSPCSVVASSATTISAPMACVALKVYQCFRHGAGVMGVGIGVLRTAGPSAGTSNCILRYVCMRVRSPSTSLGRC